MTFAIHRDCPPLREDAAGAVRVGDSRVLLELVIHAFQDGATPEGIIQQYPSLKLSDVYAVIAYYLRHASEVNAYLADRERQGKAVRERIEKSQGDLRDIRSRLRDRRQA